MASAPLLQPPPGMEGMMGQHMGSGAGPMGWWMGWGPWLGVILAVLLGAVMVLLLLLLRQRSAGVSSPPLPGPPSPSDPKGFLLGVVPEAEGAVLKPVLESPGISQPEVVHRSGYSKAKVSQVLSHLERRGLVYRVKDGKLYRVYPARSMEGGGVNGPEQK